MSRKIPDSYPRARGTLLLGIISSMSVLVCFPPVADNFYQIVRRANVILSEFIIAPVCFGVQHLENAFAEEIGLTRALNPVIERPARGLPVDSLKLHSERQPRRFEMINGTGGRPHWSMAIGGSSRRRWTRTQSSPKSRPAFADSDDSAHVFRSDHAQLDGSKNLAFSVGI